MRQFSASVRTIIDSGVISYFYLVSIGVALKHTSYHTDITFDGDVYLADNKLVNIQPPKMSSVVDREPYKIMYVDHDFSFRPSFEAGMVGQPVVVRMVFVNTTDGVLSGVNPGFPLLDPDDTIITHTGAVDSQNYSADFDSGEVTATIEASSPMAALSMVNSFYTSKNHLQQRAPGDTSFNQMYEGSPGVRLMWGKKET
jgi:hypothetical protein